MIKRLLVISLVLVVVIGGVLLVRRSIPYADSAELITTDISIDSIWSFGPVTMIYDKSSRKYYWLKSYTSLDQSGFDSLKTKRARIKHMRFLKGPLENRVYQIKVGSTIVFDQVVENDSAK